MKKCVQSVVLLICLCFLSACQDPVVVDLGERDSVGIVIRAYSDWEASVPLYAEFSLDGREMRTGAFYYCSPDEDGEISAELRRKDANGIHYIYEPDKPDDILVLAVPDKEIVYPSAEFSDDNYWEQVYSIFEDLKELVGNDSLRLVR